jgi:hypothetical protein
MKRKCTTVEELPHVSAEVVAKLFGVSRVTFASWVSDGIFDRQGTAGYDLSVVSRSLLKHYQRRAAGRGEEGEQRVLATARAREAQARARHIELRSQDYEAKNWPIERVHFLFANTFYVVIENLSGLAGRLCNRLGVADHDARTMLVEEAQGVVDEIRDYVYDRLGETQEAIVQATVEHRTLGTIKRSSDPLRDIDAVFNGEK